MGIAFNDRVFTPLILPVKDCLLFAGMGYNRFQTADALGYKPRYVQSCLEIASTNLHAVNTKQALVHALVLGELPLPSRKKIEEIISGQTDVITAR